jgi:6-phosphogluconolactonase
MGIKKFDSKDLLAKAAADYIVELSAASIKESGQFSIALSGGTTPAVLFALLVKPPYVNQIDWKKTFIFWGDERAVPLDSPQNNAHNAKEDLLNHIDIPAENVFPIPTNLPPAEAAIRYENILKQFFKSDLPKFDLILLGMGDNGHAASLFPHTTILHEQQAIVKEVWVEEVNMNRISFTAPLINNARHILFLVAGKDKEDMLHKVLEGDYKPEDYPAQLIKGAKWFVSVE